MDRLAAAVDRNAPTQVSLEITTVPADEDEMAVRIARHLAENLETAGIDVTVSPTAERKLLRDVLVNHEYDIYVARYPGYDDPDFLTELLHSRFAGEAGWQNPLGYANIDVDERLQDQRLTEDAARETVVSELQHDVVDEQPLTVLAFPDELRAVHRDQYTGWTDPSLNGPLGYLSVRSIADEDETVDELTVALTDGRVTRNRNPIAVEYRSQDSIIGLLYDPLARPVDGDMTPWLAESWEWTENRTLRVTLREGLQWHDGEPLTSGDVAFTYRFLNDTTLDADRPSIPTPRYRGKTILVDDASTVDDRTVELSFADSSREVALQALTVPVLPLHEWRERSESVDIGGFDLPHMTQALVWPNDEPVGSGPLQFESAEADVSLTLSRYEDHFLQRDAVEGNAAAFAGRPSYERLRFTVVPSDGAAVELMTQGDIDATGSALSPSEIPRVARSDDLRLLVDQTRRFYHVGYNSRRAPLMNPMFRRALAQMIDREFVVDEMFQGFATPATTPLAGTEFVTEELEWEGESTNLPFPGEGGTVTREQAREVFEEAGFRYNDDGNLVVQ